LHAWDDREAVGEWSNIAQGNNHFPFFIFHFPFVIWAKVGTTPEIQNEKWKIEK